MAHDAVSIEQETRALLHDAEGDENTQHSPIKDVKITEQQGFDPQYVLPIALLAALAMASTAATSYFAFATLLCKDPQHCQGDETVKYAGFVAIATSTANILGMSSLGHLQKLSTTNRRLGLLLWMVCRSMSAVALLAGVSVRSIYVALSARIFEGLASDNLLHFNLNAVYAQSPSKENASSLISYSLALYMIGISVSPFVAGFFNNFTTSFFMALGLFVVAIVYVRLCLPASSPRRAQATVIPQQQDGQAVGSQERNGILNMLTSLSKTVFSPLEPLRKRPTYLFIGLSLFCYNVVQSYIFDALLVHTSIRFGFTAKENGLIITTVHSIAALYIFTSIYLIPKVVQHFNARSGFQFLQHRLPTRDKYSMMATISLIVQVLSLTALGLANEAKQIYPITVLLAIGLPIPAFIKAYFLSLFEGEQKPAALAVLAMMETVGSVIGPLLLGGLQSYFSASGSVFFAAAGLGGASLTLLGIGAFIIGTSSNTIGQI
ncbi:major facilitator superfamily domain-containing protein [Xylaria telfairii]|nr:major facilitator superfamily domain-containing protein [Xylaria telfairii]